MQDTDEPGAGTEAMRRPLRLDGVATAPPLAGLVEVMRPWLAERHANPASPHGLGRAAAAALEEARTRVAALVGARAECVIFTSGATEANNLALKGLARRAREAGRRRLAVPAHEHVSLLHPARTLAGEGCELVRLPVGRDGRLLPETLEGIEGLGVLAFSHAHPELGTLQPAAALVQRAREAGARVVVDAALTVGRIPVTMSALARPDVLTLSFHHFGGPAGVGAAVLREPDLPLPPLIEGGTQERGYRPGTPNLAGCVGAGFAAQVARAKLREREAALRGWSVALRRALQGVAGLQWTGAPPPERLPGHDSWIVSGVDGEALRAALELRGFLLATASPCADEAGLPPAALRAAGYSETEARGALVSCLTPTADHDAGAVEALGEALRDERDRLAALAAGLGRY